jgi:hypothetical protein
MITILPSNAFQATSYDVCRSFDAKPIMAKPFPQRVSKAHGVADSLRRDRGSMIDIVNEREAKVIGSHTAFLPTIKTGASCLTEVNSI